MKCWGEWYGGSSYSPPYPEDREEFASLAEAKRVFIERYDGWDPVSKTRTPCVDEEACIIFTPGDERFRDTEVESSEWWVLA